MSIIDLQNLVVSVPVILGCGIGLALARIVWRLSAAVTDLTRQIDQAWTLRDQEKWALQLERENRSRGSTLYVPDVEKAQ